MTSLAPTKLGNATDVTAAADDAHPPPRQRVLGTLHVPKRGAAPAPAPPDGAHARGPHTRDTTEDEDADPVGPRPTRATHAA